MKLLERIPIKYKIDKYQVDIEYATPEKVSVFLLIILELIKKYPDRNKTVQKSLLDLSFSKELHYLFEKVIEEMIKYEIIYFDESITEDYLEYPLQLYSITQKGEKVYLTKERISKTFNENINLGFDYFYNRVLKENDIRKKQDKRENSFSVIVEASNYKESISQEIKAKPKTFIRKHITDKTEILDIDYSYIDTIELGDSIDLRTDKNKVFFEHKNQKILDAFINSKIDLNKIYPLVCDKNSKINIEKAKVYSGEMFKMQAVLFNNEEANVFIESSYTKLSLKELSKDKNNLYHFIGLTNNNEYIIFKYYVENVNGYKIPIYEISKNTNDYDTIITPIADELIRSISYTENYSNIFKLLKLIRPKKQDGFIKKILDEVPLEDKINFLRDLKRDYNEIFPKIIINVATSALLDIIKSKNNSLDKIFDIAKEFKIDAKKYFTEIRNNYSIDNELINKMIIVDEEETEKVLEVSKIIYYNLLINGRMSNFDYNGKIFANFKLFSQQLNRLIEEFEIENLILKKLPDTSEKWNKLYENIKSLKVVFSKIQKYLPDDYTIKINDFIENIIDLFYEQQTINIKIDKVDIKTFFKQTINSKNPDWISLAARLRVIIENEIRKREEEKKISGLKGKKRIQAVFNKDESNKIYTVWRFLSEYVHDNYENRSKEDIRQEFKKTYQIIQKIILSTKDNQVEFAENLNILDISKDEALKLSDKTVFAGNSKDKRFAVLEFSTKAVKRLIGPEKSVFEKEGFNVQLFERDSVLTDTGKCLNKENIMEISCFQRKTIPAVRKYADELKRKGINTVYSVATAAYRTATNRNEILKLIFNRTGINLRILPKPDEALATLVAFYFTKPSHIQLNEHTLLIDQGGGSTELSLFKEQNLIYNESFDLGTTVLESVFFQDKNISLEDAFDLAENFVYHKIKNNFNINSFPKGKSLSCISVGTAITKATNKQNNKAQHGTILRIEKLIETRKEFIKAINNRYKNLDYIYQDINNLKKQNNTYRKMLTSALGLPFFIKIMQLLDIKELVVSGTGLWYGIYFQKLYNIQ